MHASVAGATPYLPTTHTLAAMRAAVQQCKGCPLYRNATQAVFGEGAQHAPLLLVGEQPGNDEDLAGHPFVGPSGKVLDDALDEAGIDRRQTFITNVVKHFKWEARGDRRLHKKPDASEIAACLPWLEQEIARVKPQVVVGLGATAAQALFGRSIRVTVDHGRDIPSDWAPHAIVTIHPAAILRQRTHDERAHARAGFVADLAVAAHFISAR
jgi:DNA polymerase